MAAKAKISAQTAVLQLPKPGQLALLWLFPWGFFACSFSGNNFCVSLFSHITARSQTPWISGSLPNQRECLWCNLETQPSPRFRPLGLPTATPWIRGHTADLSLAFHPPGNHMKTDIPFFTFCIQPCMPPFNLLIWSASVLLPGENIPPNSLTFTDVGNA